MTYYDISPDSQSALDCMEALRRWGPLTARGLTMRAGWSHSQTQRAVAALMRAGRVEAAIETRSHCQGGYRLYVLRLAEEAP